MKANKIVFLILLNMFFLTSWSQIIITEVHFDTPFNEENQGGQNTGPHHIGEYIELYNYSSEDINLKGWYILDYIGKYSFPETVTIASGQFLILAYRDQAFMWNNNHTTIGFGTPNYFPLIFPNTIGQETKIIYQDRIILRNITEKLSLHVGYLKGTNCNGFKIQEISFGKYGNPNDLYFSPDATSSPTTYDFYTSNSIHLQSDLVTYSTNYPTPLEEEHTPAIQDLEDIETVIDAFESNYSNITWEDNCNEILSAICGLLITETEQSPTDTYLDTGKCFVYDVSGNTTSITDCLPTDDPDPNPSTEYTPEEIADIESKIILYPNPTSGIITVSWDATINGKISQIQANSTSGVSVVNIYVAPLDSTKTLDISIHPTGIYIVKFLLDTGQFISKNVIKI